VDETAEKYGRGEPKNGGEDNMEEKVLKNKKKEKKRKREKRLVRDRNRRAVNIETDTEAGYGENIRITKSESGGIKRS
jgi:hypothetical protein